MSAAQRCERIVEENFSGGRFRLIIYLPSSLLMSRSAFQPQVPTVVETFP